ncbi:MULTISPECIES: acetylxylan esterase [Actinomyces]|uniref:Acetylxylan esterase n=1 Tax=Actinomyces respiraculi TaxID=2744574 RepID=A0A7T0LJ37_9ACTO|nr:MULTISPECIES: acetylxylan esterase [Actinomyces]QPL04642.1 acetylxylan esterase [Actinomyces respiraculi]
MPTLDMSLPELRAYAPELDEPADFDAWWAEQLQSLHERPELLSDEIQDTPFPGMVIRELVFAGADDDPVHALLTLPAARAEQDSELTGEPGLPGVVQCVGYGGGRGLPGQVPWYAMAGFAHLIVDPRGQGGDWAYGSTPDPSSAGAHAAGWLTDGVQAPETYYYRRTILDSVAAVRLMRTLEDVDASRIACVGGSQGGGLSLAAAALDGHVQAVCIDSPFITHIPRALQLASAGPYLEMERFLAVHPQAETTVARTLSYIDGASFASRLDVPTLFSVGLLDPVCPPSTCFAAHNLCPAPDKRIDVYPYGAHAGGGHRQVLAHCRWLQEHL